MFYVLKISYVSQNNVISKELTSPQGYMLKLIWFGLVWFGLISHKSLYVTKAKFMFLPINSYISNNSV